MLESSSQPQHGEGTGKLQIYDDIGIGIQNATPARAPLSTPNSDVGITGATGQLAQGHEWMWVSFCQECER